MRGAPDVDTRNASRMGDPGRNQRAAAGAEHLQVNVIVACIDRHHHRQRVVGGDQWRGKGGQR